MAIPSLSYLANATFTGFSFVVQQATNYPIVSIASSILFATAIPIIYKWNNEDIVIKNNEIALNIFKKIFNSESKSDEEIIENFIINGYMKLSRSTYTDLARSVIIQNLGNSQNNFTLNMNIVSLVHHKEGIIGKGGKKIQKYGKNSKGEILVKGRFFHVPSNLLEMKEITKEVKSLPYVMFGDIAALKTKECGVQVSLFTPYAESDLEKMILSGSLKYDEKLHFAIQLLEGLLGLHKKGIYHRDIKPDNILIYKGKAHLADGDFATKTISAIQSGTTAYEAPESINDLCWSETYKKPGAYMKTDIYSMGIVFYKLFHGNHPLYVSNKTDINFENLSLLNKEWFEKDYPMPDAKAPKIEHLIWKMKHIDPDMRPTTEEALAKMKKIVYPNKTH